MGAFDEIVNRYYRGIYRTAYHFTHNCEDAYDISQEVFLKVFKSLGNLRNSSIFNTWLRRIAVNTCIDFLRTRPNEHAVEDFSCLGHQYILCRELQSVHTEMDELRSMISKAVGRLPERQRKAFVLRHYEGLSLAEIATTLNRSQGTIKASLFHAARNLRRLLLPYVS